MGAVGAVSLLAAGAGTATAATQSQYAPGAQARNFTGGDGGWAGSAVYSSATCTGPLIGFACPSVTPAYVPAGGTGGPSDGFIDSQLNGVLATQLNDSTAVWQSPRFTFEPGSTTAPSSVGFGFNTQAAVSALVTAGETVTYEIELVDAADPAGTVTLASGPVADTTAWTAMPAVTVNPSQLKVGRDYFFRITTSFGTAAALVPSGSVGYDDVVLTAVRKGSSGGGGGRQGPAGGIVGGGALLKGNKLFVRVFCAKGSKPRCRIKLTAYVKRHGAKATKAKKTSVAAGKRKRVGLKLRRGYRSQLENRKKVLVKQVVQVKGERPKTKLKRLKLHHR